jgi:CHAT domain-containing protein/Tfp pilus assembly protein PilF
MTASGHARRDFCRMLAGMAAVAALPLPASAGDFDDGMAAWARGDLRAAITAWEAALRGAKEPALRVELLVRLASAHRELGELGRARGRLAEAEAMGLLLAAVANARGLLQLSAGEVAAAEASFRWAFATAQTDKDVPLAATAANNLGLARMGLGRPDDALTAFEAAGGLFGLLGDRNGMGDVATNLGLAHLRAGRLREARASLELAPAHFEAVGNAVGMVDAQNDLGIVLQALGLDVQAQALYERALKAAPDPRRKAAVTANLATLAHRKGDLVRARTLYADAEGALTAAGRTDEAVAVALQRALLGTPDAAEYRRLHAAARDPRVRATAALNLAGLVWESAPDEARRLLDEARRTAGGLGTVAWRADALDGRMAIAAGRREDGIRLLSQAVDALERTRRGLSESEAAGFRAEYAGVYEALLDARLAGGDLRGAAAAAERLALADHDEPPVAGDAAQLELRALADRQTWLERALASASPEEAESLRAQLGHVHAEFSSRIDALRASHPHFAELVRTDPEDLEAVRGQLPVGVVVLQVVMLPTRLALLIYRAERLVVREVSVTSNELSAKVYGLARAMRAVDIWDPDWTRTQCEELGGLLIAPVATELASAHTVVVSATGVFRQLPFGLLRFDGAWLAEKVGVVSVTHVGSLRHPVAPFTIDAKRMLLVGNPDGTLPGAEAEVRAISQNYKGAKVLVGSEGVRERVYAECKGRSLVHLATHGMLDPSFPDKSLIVLTGYPGEAGQLAYREIPSLSAWLDATRLVILSACESGLPGDIVATTQPPMAVNGLAGQFRRAGVETLIASLWSVADEGTMALMTAFYEELGKGRDLAMALAVAQRRLIADPKFSHPFFWAPFVIVGDWR